MTPGMRPSAPPNASNDSDDFATILEREEALQLLGHGNGLTTTLDSGTLERAKQLSALDLNLPHQMLNKTVEDCERAGLAGYQALYHGAGVRR